MKQKATIKWGSGRIKKEDIPATIKFVSSIIGIPIEDLHPLGSTGKSTDSGDIDLAVDANKYSIDSIHEKMMQNINYMGTYNKGTKIGSYAINIAGDSTKGKVQVDIMPSHNIEMFRFLYHSQGDKSKYKGAVRTILLMSIASALNEKGMDHFVYDNDILIIRAGRSIELSRGLKRIFQYRPKKKRGGGYLKMMKTISIEEFKEMFPDIVIKGENTIVNDPQEIVDVLFDKGVKIDDVESAEQVISIIRERFSEEKQQVIFERAIDRIKQAHLQVPEEIKNAK